MRSPFECCLISTLTLPLWFSSFVCPRDKGQKVGTTTFTFFTRFLHSSDDYLIGHIILFSTCESHPFSAISTGKGTVVSLQSRGQVTKALLSWETTHGGHQVQTFVPTPCRHYMTFYYPEGHSSGHIIELPCCRGHIIII